MYSRGSAAIKRNISTQKNDSYINYFAFNYTFWVIPAYYTVTDYDYFFLDIEVQNT
jgi:hypothetical protein